MCVKEPKGEALTSGIGIEEVCVANADSIVDVEVHFNITDAVLELEDGNLCADQVNLVQETWEYKVSTVNALSKNQYTSLPTHVLSHQYQEPSPFPLPNTHTSTECFYLLWFYILTCQDGY